MDDVLSPGDYLAKLMEDARELYQEALLLQLRGLPLESMARGDQASQCIDTAITEIAARGL